MGGPRTPHFYDFGTFERAPSSQNQLSLSLETPGHQKETKETPKTFQKHIVSINQQISELHSFDIFQKDGRQQIMKIRIRTNDTLGYGINIYKKHEREV